MVGAGQLARMSQRAAIDLGIHLEVLAEDEAHQRLYRKAGFALRDRYCLMTRTL